MLYSAETWTTSRHNENKLSAKEMEDGFSRRATRKSRKNRNQEPKNYKMYESPTQN